MSKDTTFSAPRSISIYTRRIPTKPVPPVTTQRFGTYGNERDATRRCKGDKAGLTCVDMINN